ncbi:hypothetical protein [Actinophytocola sp.]|uniref:hypothetical protein n=1 Tax=Actinophytocola sp. TaxID=1872138 RepID=UPI002ED17F06
MSHYDAAADSGRAYHALVAKGLDTPHGHLAAAELAGHVAEQEDAHAARAATPASHVMFLRAADRARATRDRHKLLAAAFPASSSLPTDPRCVPAAGHH